MGQGRRTPDFRVFDDDELAFYCEVKTAQEDDWLDKKLADAPPLTLVGGGRLDSTYNRTSGHIHSATGQFDAVNPALVHANVLAIVNGDDMAGFTDLIQVLTGNAYCAAVKLFRCFANTRRAASGRRNYEHTFIYGSTISGPAHHKCSFLRFTLPTMRRCVGALAWAQAL